MKSGKGIGKLLLSKSFLKNITTFIKQVKFGGSEATEVKDIKKKSLSNNLLIKAAKLNNM